LRPAAAATAPKRPRGSVAQAAAEGMASV